MPGCPRWALIASGPIAPASLIFLALARRFPHPLDSGGLRSGSSPPTLPACLPVPFIASSICRPCEPLRRRSRCALPGHASPGGPPSERCHVPVVPFPFRSKSTASPLPLRPYPIPRPAAWRGGPAGPGYADASCLASSPGPPRPLPHPALSLRCHSPYPFPSPVSLAFASLCAPSLARRTLHS